MKAKTKDILNDQLMQRIRMNEQPHISIDEVFKLFNKYTSIHQHMNKSRLIKSGRYTVVVNGHNAIEIYNFGFGDLARVATKTNLVFFNKSCKCVCCGLEGQYFRKQVQFDNLNIYALNLFASYNGHEILFNKDHLIPKSLGGNNLFENFVPCCKQCNEIKSNSLLSWDELRKQLYLGTAEFGRASAKSLQEVTERIRNNYKDIMELSYEKR